MASLIPQTKAMLVERIKRHISDDFPNADFGASNNEMILYIDQAIAATLVGQVYNNAKLEGNLAMPEGYLSTFLLPAAAKNNITGYWTTTLPQPPVSLPLGYSITRGYFADAAYGTGTDIIWIKSKRVARRGLMPKQFGVSGWVEGSTLFLEASNNIPLNGVNFYVTMAKTRTTSLDEPLLIPDDAIEAVFQNVVAKLMQRMAIPKDEIQDDVSVGASNISNK